MNATLTAITDGLHDIIARLQKQVPNDEPFMIAHGNWSFPAITRSELIEEIQELIDDITQRAPDGAIDNEDAINDYVRRLDYIDANLISNVWGNAGQAVTALLYTIRGLRRAVESSLKLNPAREQTKRLRDLGTQVRAIEARLEELGPRSQKLEEMVRRIEAAYEAADQLPTDLQLLSESKIKINSILESTTSIRSSIDNISADNNKVRDELKSLHSEAESVLSQSKTAYAAATSVGLAAAFTERSKSLSWSTWVWVGSLVVSLSAGTYFGTDRIKSFSAIINGSNPSTSIVVANILLSILTVGAPIWFSWLATKQIGQRFRIAEDYAFKASVARAYEGFRREAARIDENLEVRLLASALTRLDEEPLRLVESHTHGSPFHEIMSSETIKRAIETIPNFASEIKTLSARAITATKRKPFSDELGNEDE